MLAIVAPLGVFAAVSVQRAWRRQLANVERQNVANARAISVAIDQQVQRTTAALEVLGELHALDAPDLPAFESLASRILPYHPHWSAILLSDSDGNVIDGVPDRKDGDASASGKHWARATVDAKQTTVSDMVTVPGITGRQVIVSVPIVRNGRIALVLGARLATRALSETLHLQQTPPDGAVGLIGSDLRMIARAPEEEEFAGTVANSQLMDLARQRPDGSLRVVARNGKPTYAAFSRSPQTGLIVGIGFPAEQVDGPIRRILWLLAGAWAVVLALGAGLGLLLGRVIVRAMESASAAAMALARGEAVAPPPSRITEIDELASGLRRAADTLQMRNRERDEASRLKDEFLMTVSHELRTPLTAICGWSRMLATGQIRDDQRPRAIEAIERNAGALRQLVEDLLDVSRIVSGKLRLDVARVDLVNIVAGAVDTISPAAEAKGITLQTNMAADAASISGDAARLQQVLWNLLSNAVRFTPHGGQILVECRRIGETVELNVSDTGTGIDPNFLPHVFERFRQGMPATTRPHGGLGLGLAIVRHLVELHGGTVTAENNSPRPGATFRVTLPAAARVTYSDPAVAERIQPAPSAAIPTIPTSAAS